MLSKSEREELKRHLTGECPEYHEDKSLHMFLVEELGLKLLDDLEAAEARALEAERVLRSDGVNQVLEQYLDERRERMISQEELDRLLALCQAATPGPWESHATQISGRPYVALPREEGEPWGATLVFGSNEAHKDNAAFIAAARTALPTVLEELVRLREVLAECPECQERLKTRGIKEEGR